MKEYLAAMYGKQSPDFVKGFLAAMYVSNAAAFPPQEFSERMREAVAALAEVPEDFDELIKAYA